MRQKKTVHEDKCTLIYGEGFYYCVEHKIITMNLPKLYSIAVAKSSFLDEAPWYKAKGAVVGGCLSAFHCLYPGFDVNMIDINYPALVEPEIN